MKKILLALTASLMMFSTIASAQETKSRFETETMNGSTLVLIPMETAQKIDRITRGSLSTQDKINKIRLSLSSLAAKQGDESYCEKIGETYATANKSAAEMTKKCFEVLDEKGMKEFVNELPDLQKDMNEFRRTISAAVVLMIAFPF